jgi:hypothetical protein
MWGSFVSVFLIGSLRGLFLFNYDRPKVALVAMYMEEDKIRKFYKERNKGFFGYWVRIMRNRNNGIILGSLGSGVCVSFSIGSYDAAQHFLSDSMKNYLIPNILLGTFFDYLSKCALVPIRKIITEKRKSKIIKDQEHPYIYEN